MKASDVVSVSEAAAGGTLEVSIVRAGVADNSRREDRIVVEAPLEFQLHHPALGHEPVSFGTTMRTPGDDESLVAGLLYGESIIERAGQIEAIESSTRRPNVINVRLRPEVELGLNVSPRRFSAGSSCGVCGTTGLDAAIARAAATQTAWGACLEMAEIFALPQRMRLKQTKFADTGGIHAAAVFDLAGDLLHIAEDVGRHNALDKLVGIHLLAGSLPLLDRVVVLSGRASYELTQKAIRAGAPMLVAIGAPSSLAVNLASASGLTLVGFVREAHCNVYTHPQRLTQAGVPLTD